MWVEIPILFYDGIYNWVTPSRVCELKFALITITKPPFLSHPHGCVSWNMSEIKSVQVQLSHTLTGVWVEILSIKNPGLYLSHTLTGVWVEMKRLILWKMRKKVTPSRVCELTYQTLLRICDSQGHTLTGVWVEIAQFTFVNTGVSSHPHGCVSWNLKFLT